MKDQRVRIKENCKNLNQNTKNSCGSNRLPPKYKFRVLPPQEPILWAQRRRFSLSGT